jgi:hypothetical protein
MKNPGNGIMRTAGGTSFFLLAEALSISIETQLNYFQNSA